MQVHYLDTPTALAEACASIAGATCISVDTEFVRENTYYPIPCLVQIATITEFFVVDAIALEELTPLFDVLYDPQIEKILHSGRQDLELFFNVRGEVPGPIFDTQIAAALLGHGEQLGYAALVEIMFGEKLDKAHTRTDWRRRPLSPSKIRYAIDDVRFLLELRDRLHAELAALDRNEWLVTECIELTDAETYQIDKTTLWRRVKDHRRLSGARLAVLQALASWREERAMHENQPRKWILSDELLIALAQHMPESHVELAGLVTNPANAIKRYGKSLLEVIAAARIAAPEAWPVVDASRDGPLNAKQRALLEEISSLVKAKAREYGINSTTIAARKDLKEVALGTRDNRLFKGWRHDVAGRFIEERLAD